MLGNHPEMFGLAETNLFVAETVADLEQIYRLRSRLQHGLVRSIAELGFQEQSEETVEAARAWLAKNAEMSTIELFSVLAEWQPGRSLVEKSPFHTYKLEALRRMQRGFPNASYLHLVRHPAPMWNSLMDMRQRMAETTVTAPRLRGGGRDRHKGEAELDPEKVWLRPHLTILEFLQDVPPEQQLQIRGEDLLEQPQFYLAQICEWLGKRIDSEAIESMLHPEQSPFARYGPSNARFGNDPNFMENPKLRRYEKKHIPLDEFSVSDRKIGFSETLLHYAQFFGY